MTVIQRLSPLDAHARIATQADARLIDVRDPVEFSFVAHPAGAINVPWKWAPDMRPNPDFIDQVRNLAPVLSTPIYLLCRSGQRSLAAAEALAAAGYTDLTNIEDGFEGPQDAQQHRNTVRGWRFEGLPWVQS